VGAFFSQPVNVEVTREEVEALRREQTELLALVREMKTKLDEQGETTTAMRADTNAQLQSIEERIENIGAQLEDQGTRMDRSLRRVEDIRATRPPAAPPGGADSLGGAATSIPETRPASSENEVYDAAYRDYSRGNYQLAIAGFQDFLKSFPQSDRADNAQYWLGECFFALGDLDKAVEELLKVRDMYPAGNKVCAATLKIGYAFLRKADNPTARRYFESVVRECPGTDEARLAQDKLASLR
jgi:tol-pal system protein YbgF